MTQAFAVALAISSAGLLAACAQKTLALPTGRGTAIADTDQLQAGLTKACIGIRTLTAELALSGRAGAQRVRGRALVGFQTPDAMRLEGLAPIGQPAFILVSRGGATTLLLPRDDRVLRDASAEDILGALTGVALAPADLQAILTGCVVRSPRVVSGEELGDWAIANLEGNATAYLRRTRDGMQLRAARRDNWQIEYPEWQGGFPRRVRLISSATPPVDVTAQVSQIETNVDLESSAFTVDVPRDALPITLEELREAGPLRGTSAPTSRRDNLDQRSRESKLHREFREFSELDVLPDLPDLPASSDARLKRVAGLEALHDLLGARQ
jgi:outer membrane biogenesis lipoprotein LolB